MSGAKYHVSEILGKLDLENRHDAARWRPDDARPPIFAPPGLRHRFGTWLSPAITGALALAIAIGAALLVWALIASRGSEAATRPNAAPQSEETLTVSGLVFYPGTEQQLVARISSDPAVIAAMRRDLLTLPTSPMCNGSPCIYYCPYVFGAPYSVAVLHPDGSATLRANLRPGCSGATIVIGNRGWSRTWLEADQIRRDAPSGSPVWDVIAQVLGVQRCVKDGSPIPGLFRDCP